MQDDHTLTFDYSPFPIEQNFFTTHLDRTLTEVTDPVLFTPTSQTRIILPRKASFSNSPADNKLNNSNIPDFYHNKQNSTDCISIEYSLQTDLTRYFPFLQGKIALVFQEITRVEKEWDIFVKYE